MKLIGMTEFVLKKDSTCIFKYANFLKQPLELWMFVPCKQIDGVWEVMEYPNVNQYPEKLCDFCPLDKKGNYGVDGGYMAGCEGSKCDTARENYDEEYNQAKERVLFEGFTFKEIKTSYEHYYIVNNEKITWLSWNKSKTVENLLDYNQEIKLTESAIKQLGL